MNKSLVIIGLGGHGLVAADIFILNGFTITGYCDTDEKPENPFGLTYLGQENEYFSTKPDVAAFVAIGDIELRERVVCAIAGKGAYLENAIHPSSVVASTVTIGKSVFIAAHATINPMARLGDGVICNTSSSIDHECVIGRFSHICPGTILCGNVTIGIKSFIGAGSVIKPGITIGDNVIIGAGSVVVKDIMDPGIYFGNPAVLR